MSVKGIGIESFVSGLLFIGIDIELQKKEVWVEGKEKMRYDKCGWNGDVL